MLEVLSTRIDQKVNMFVEVLSTLSIFKDVCTSVSILQIFCVLTFLFNICVYHNSMWYLICTVAVLTVRNILYMFVSSNFVRIIFEVMITRPDSYCNPAGLVHCLALLGSTTELFQVIMERPSSLSCATNLKAVHTI